MRTIAHLSDLHFGRADPVVVEGLLRDLALRRPSLIVISGDLVQRAGPRHFTAARAFLERLEQPYLVIPGNHDIPAYNLWLRFTDPFGRYRRYISQDLSPFFIDSEIAVLGLNTARSLNLNFAHGRINRHQIARIAEVFGEVAPPVVKILVTHHPFLPPADAPGTHLLGRAALALPVLEAAGVDLLLAGHLHRGYTGRLSDHHLEVVRTILVVQASTATSTRRRNEPNGYHWLTVDGAQLICEERRWSGSAFVANSRCCYCREPAGWVPGGDAATGRDLLAPALA